jgi:hypothetical protein
MMKLEQHQDHHKPEQRVRFTQAERDSLPPPVRFDFDFDYETRMARLPTKLRQRYGI